MVKMSAWKTKGWKARRSEVGGQRSETIQQNPEAEPVSITMALLGAYIVRLKVTQISDDSNPDKERRRPEQDAAQVIVCEVLRKEKKAPLRRAPRAPLTMRRTESPLPVSATPAFARLRLQIQHAFPRPA